MNLLIIISYDLKVNFNDCSIFHLIPFQYFSYKIFVLGTNNILFRFNETGENITRPKFLFILVV